jgi:hypothetical protein
MGISVVKICNLALSKLGDDSITDLTDDSKPARACNLVYDHTRDTVLGDFPWNSIMRRARLAQLAATPEFGYQYKYQLPTNPYCLKVWYVSADGHNDDTDRVDWVIEGRELLTDETVIYISYSAQIADVAQYTPLLVEAIACHLAADLCEPLVKSGPLKQALMGEYNYALGKAQTSDADEGTGFRPRGDYSWISVRR